MLCVLVLHCLAQEGQGPCRLPTAVPHLDSVTQNGGSGATLAPPSPATSPAGSEDLSFPNPGRLRGHPPPRPWAPAQPAQRTSPSPTTSPAGSEDIPFPDPSHQPSRLRGHPPPRPWAPAWPALEPLPPELLDLGDGWVRGGHTLTGMANRFSRKDWKRKLRC